MCRVLRVFAGKLFYHGISTEAHRALQEGNAQHYQQLAAGMRVTLAALADRIQALAPAQIDAIKAKIRARQLRLQQQQTVLGHAVPHIAATAAGGQLHAHPTGVAVTLLVQHDGGSTSAFPQGGISQLPPHPQPGLGGAADTGGIAASSITAGSGGALPLAGSSTSSNIGSRFAGHKRQHSSSNGSRWSNDVLWILHHEYLFHTSWSSSRSPPYHGLLLEQIAAELFGADFTLRIAA
jgi:hypothetical protein